MTEELIDAAALIFRFVLAFAFLHAAIPKLVVPRDFERAVENYRLLPPALVHPVAAWLPRVELTCAVALLAGFALAPVAWLVAILLLIFAGAIGLNLARGRVIDCGCFNSTVPRRIGWRLVTGDLVLAGLAVAVALASPGVLTVAHAAPSTLESGDAIGLVVVAAVVWFAYQLPASWADAVQAARRQEARL